MSVVCALKDLCLPKVSLNDNDEKVVDLTCREKTIELSMYPVSTTYGEVSGLLLLDPTLRETELGR